MSSNQREDGSKLKALIEDLEERINCLKLFDRREEINTHCDDLISGVIQIVASAVDRLNKMQEDMTNEINCYRADLLAAKEMTESSEDNDKPKQELERLAKKLSSFSIKCQAYFEIESLDGKYFNIAEAFKEKIRDLRRELRAQAFKQRGFMRHIEDGRICNRDFPVGSLIVSHKDTEDNMKIKHLIIDESDLKDSLLPIYSKEDKVSTLLVLRDGNLAVKLEHHPILIWNSETRQTIFELETCERCNEIYSFAQLPSGLLISADDEGYIDVWDLDARCHARVLDQLQSSAKSLRVLPNGNLAGFNNWEIIVWNPTERRDKCRLLEIKCPPYGDMRVEVLCNGFLALSCVVYNGLTIHVWNSETGELVKRVSLPGREIMGCSLLPDGDVSVFFHDATVHFYSLIDGRLFQTAQIVKSPVIAVKQQANNSLLLVQINSPRMRAFVPESSRAPTDSNWLSCANVSADGRRLAIGALSAKLVVRSLGN